MKKLHVIPVLCLLCSALYGQFNLKAGYSLTFTEAKTHNSIIAAHEMLDETSFSEHYKPLETLHGMDIGLEYRWESFSMEFGWRVKRNRQEGSGVHAGQAFRNKLRYSMSSFYTGFVQYLGPVRVEATLDFTYLRNKLDFDQPPSISVIRDNTWGSQFSLGYVLNGSGPVSLVIAPQVQFVWSDFNLSPLEQALTGSTAGPVYEDYFNYGITLMFLNGPR